ncbi:hypothetical protein GCM10027066_22690 [Dyella jejuensis]
MPVLDAAGRHSWCNDAGRQNITIASEKHVSMSDWLRKEEAMRQAKDDLVRSHQSRFESNEAPILRIAHSDYLRGWRI